MPSPITKKIKSKGKKVAKPPKSLVVVESPAKARTMGRFLGEDFVVKASLGHIRDLPPNKLGVEIENGFSPKYVISKGKRPVVTELKAASKDVAMVYLATDPDREGEAIAWHLVHAAGWDQVPIQRVVFHEITEEAIQEAFRHPRDIDMDLVNSQQARRVLDRLVGYQLSPLLWKKIQRGLSAGRVQSVALRLVVDREREITRFVPKEYWKIQANLRKEGTNENNDFSALLHRINGQTDKLHIESEEHALSILQNLNEASYKIRSVLRKETRRRPAAPFTTSTLQQEASRKLRFSVKKTMLIAQQLYEGLQIGTEGSVGLITYMRTDSTHVANSAIKETQVYIRDRFGSAYTPKSPRHYSKKSKGAQEAHEAIRPTSIRREPDTVQTHLSSEQSKLYNLIWNRMVSSQMSDTVYDSTQVDIEALTPKYGYVFRATGSVLKFPGFRALYFEGRDDDNEEEAVGILPNLEEDNYLQCLGIDPSQHFTHPPSSYSEATLVKALEEKGIGRPSTYVPIISTILDRGYVEKNKGRFKPTRLGEVVSDQLTNHFPDIMNFNFTAQMEEHLDGIARGERDWVPVLKDFYTPFSEALRQAEHEMPRIRVEEPTDEVCEKCERPMVIKRGRFGPFISCSGFPECRNARPILQKTGVACPKCNNDLVQRRGKGPKKKVFYGCSSYPSCDFTLPQKPLPEPCPECSGILVASARELAQCTQCDYKGPVPETTALEPAM
jgi:DNA topoisomerase-1